MTKTTANQYRYQSPKIVLLLAKKREIEDKYFKYMATKRPKQIDDEDIEQPMTAHRAKLDKDNNTKGNEEIKMEKKKETTTDLTTNFNHFDLELGSEEVNYETPSSNTELGVKLFEVEGTQDWKKFEGNRNVKLFEVEDAQEEEKFEGNRKDLDDQGSRDRDDDATSMPGLKTYQGMSDGSSDKESDDSSFCRNIVIAKPEDDRIITNIDDYDFYNSDKTDPIYPLDEDSITNTTEGESDSEYAKDPSRRSVNSGATYLNNALIRLFCKMMPIVALSTSEAELYAAVLTAIEMMFTYYIVTQLGLNVKLPMILYVDNKGAVDLANNWSVGGRTRHIGVKQSYLKELKGIGYLQVLHKPGKDLVTDSGTKNVGTVEFWKQTSTYMS